MARAIGFKYEDIFDLVYEAWSDRQHQSDAPRWIITQLLKGILQQSPGCTLVVDGLDECASVSDERRVVDGYCITVAKFLQDLIQATATTSTRILIVSRDEPDIRQVLESDIRGNLVEIRITAEDNLTDVAALSRAIVNRKLPNKSDDVRDGLSASMAHRCDGQLLWLTMQEASLRRGMNKRQLQKTIDDMPIGIELLYERNWNRITHLKEDDRNRAFELLRWAAFSLRPLTVGEITEAVLIDPDSDIFPADDLPDEIDDDYIDTEILGLCSPLLEVRTQPAYASADQRTIHLAHFTVKQYLLYSLPIKALSANERLRQAHERRHNTILARFCLIYMQYQQVYRDSEPVQDVLFRRSLRDYAFQSWPGHVRSGVDMEEDRDISDLVFGFMSETEPSWRSWKEWFDAHVVDEEWESVWAAKTQATKPLYCAIQLDLTGAAIRHFHAAKSMSLNIDEARLALSLACFKGNTTIVKAMLDAGIDIRYRGFEGRTPLYLAAQNGQVDLVKLLLQSGADVAVKTDFGRTPVNSASMNGHLEVVRLLVDHGADITIPDRSGLTPVNMACLKGHLETVRFLVKRGADITTPLLNGTTSINLAVRRGHFDIASFLIDRGVDIAFATNEGYTPVHAASIFGAYGLTRLLLDRGADVTVSDRRGYTPIHGAASYGHIEVTGLLLDRGADVASSDCNGTTPLHEAATSGCVGVTKLLLDRGADIAVLDSDGFTPLHEATHNGNLEVTKLLLDRGADIAVPDSNGSTPIHEAVKSGNLELIDLLLDRGASVNVRNSKGWTPVSVASHRGSLEAVRLLVNRGADITIPNSYGRAPIHTASNEGQLKTVRLLLDISRILVDSTDSVGRTALFLSSKQGYHDIVKTLVSDYGALHTLNDRFGNSPLSASVRNGHFEVVKTLLETGNTFAEILEPSTRPLIWWARRRGDERIVNFLQDYAKEAGVLLPPDNPPIESRLVSPRESLFWCDACTLDISYGSPTYECQDCPDEKVSVCGECFLLGNRCRYVSHSLKLVDYSDEDDSSGESILDG